MAKEVRLIVLISGNGSNLQALLSACDTGQISANILGVLSNRSEAYGLRRAEKYNIPTIVFHRLTNRADYDEDLGNLVATFKPDWIILAGWMHILSMKFLEKFPNKVVNLHPALPGQFPGTKAIERAYTAYQQGQIEQTGIMVHLVPDEGVDDGPVLATQTVPILPDDSVASLAERMHQTEHALLVETIRKLVVGEIDVKALSN
ncbi:phosphoribosylglycinamide formyltransferase [Anaerolineales bacterium HSG6]|nr:phosphoribosylglycinamide formyltransferase [Anaerolineales bacterium HSG6]